MKLTFEQIKSITTGAALLRECEDGIHFERFTEEEGELYRLRGQTTFGAAFPEKVPATAGVRLTFRTNSQSLGLSFAAIVSSRRYFSVAVYKDSEEICTIGNLNDYERIDPIERKKEFGETEYSASVPLGAGEGVITIYLPWSVAFILHELTIDDGATMVPVAPHKVLLVYGDSITQGYDAVDPSVRYASRLADALGAVEYNKAIGGEVFFPALASAQQTFVPDYISVAYGTNDWGRGVSYPEFRENCKQFFANLREKYPNATIFAITPIWRRDAVETRNLGDISLVRDYIAELAPEYDLKVIIGDGLVPADPTLFADKRLHPNDKGLAYYADGVVAEAKRLLGVQ